MQLEMLLLTCDSIKKWVTFSSCWKGPICLCHFPFVRTNFGFHNPPSLHNNYYVSVQTINLSFLYEQSP
jgi:hypothetical protein